MILQSHQNRIARRAAFTLMEVLVVVAIIVILAGLGGFMLINQYEDAKGGAATGKLKTVDNAVTAYYIKYGNYPDNLNVLVGPYLKSQNELLDPWNNPIVYSVNDSGYDLFITNPKTGQQIRN